MTDPNAEDELNHLERPHEKKEIKRTLIKAMIRVCQNIEAITDACEERLSHEESHELISRFFGGLESGMIGYRFIAEAAIEGLDAE